MGKNIKGITIEIDGKTTGLTKALKQANSEIKSTQNNLKAIDKALKLDPTNIEMIKAKQNALNDVIAETKNKLDIEKKAAEEAKKELELGNITQAEYDALQAEVVTTTDKLKSLQDEAKACGSAIGTAMEAAGQKVTELGNKIDSVGQKITNEGESMTKNLTVPIVAAGTASVASYKEVDDGLDIIAKKTGAAGTELEAYEDIAKNLATSIPTSFEEAGAAVGEVNTRFGVTGQELEALSAQFIKFAQLNNTDVSNSIDSVQKVMAAYNVDVNDANDLLDILNATAQKTGISVDKLSDLMVTNSASLQQMGFDANSAAAFLGNVEKSGADTSQVMSGLQKALKNATDSGIPLDDALREIQDSMVNAESETEALQYAYELFGSKAGAAIYQACKNGSLNFEDLSSSMESSLGNVNATYESVIDETDELKVAMNTAKVATAEVGKTIASSVAPVIKIATEHIKNFGIWWKNLSSTQQQTIITILAVVAAIGPLIAIIGKLVSTVGLIVAGVGKVISVGGTVINGVKAFSTFISATLVPNITGLIAAITPFIGVIVAVIAAITAIIVVIKNWDAIVEACQMIWEEFTDRLESLIEGFKTFFQNAFQAIGDFFKNIWDNIVNVASAAWSGVQNVFASVGSWFTGIFQSAWDGITGIFNKLGGFFSGIWDSVTGIFKDAGVAVADAISGAVKAAVNAVLSGAINIINGFISAINGVIGVINKIPGVSLSKINKLDVPQLYRGGVLEKGQLGLLEGSGAEAVVPLDQNSKWIKAVAKDMKDILDKDNQPQGGDIVIPVYIGSSKIQDMVVEANQINNYRSGGR